MQIEMAHHGLAWVECVEVLKRHDMLTAISLENVVQPIINTITKHRAAWGPTMPRRWTAFAFFDLQSGNQWIEASGALTGRSPRSRGGLVRKEGRGLQKMMDWVPLKGNNPVATAAVHYLLLPSLSSVGAYVAFSRRFVGICCLAFLC